jgi:TonB family protein
VVLIRRHIGPAFAASLVSHIAMVAVLLLAMRVGRGPVPRIVVESEHTTPRMVWLQEPGPGGGGGGGGNRMKDPPRQAKLPGQDTVTVPAAKPRGLDSGPTIDEQPPVPRLIIPVATLAASTELLPGAIQAPPGPPTLSQGPGTDDGAGTGRGTGDGPGLGPGFGRGRDGGMDGDVYRPGNGVTMPIEIQKGTPRYTTDAMRARIQGSITVECVVQTNGVCSRIHVTRSFDPAFGLDQEAIKAAAQWRFRPGTRRGEPVPVLVTMEIAFALR